LTNSYFDSLAAKSLVWLPEFGVGYYPVTEAPYDAAYWEKYLAMDASATGERLTADRAEFVKDFSEKGLTVCDIGIGGGRFVREMDAKGFDINPKAVGWLTTEGRWHDPYAAPVDVATFWDSLEHIHNPAPLLANVKRWAFMSVPIFEDSAHILRSKHFRKDEHCWYFTRQGLMRFMRHHGFECVSVSFMEQNAGREDIESFAFQRMEEHG